MPIRMSMLRASPDRALWVTIAFAVLIWCATFVAMFTWEMHIEHARFNGMMSLKAEMLSQNTQAVREWVGGHGGVYVAVGGGIQPNPLLSGQEERDIVTPSGRQLTLFNSPALLRHVNKHFESASGTRIRLVSRLPVNPENVLQDWQENGYAALEGGEKSFTELVESKDRANFRLMRPMILKGGCLSCHAGYGEGDVGKMIGALSIDLDVTEDQKAHEAFSDFLLMTHIGFWGLGLAGITGAAWKWRHLLHRLRQMATHDPLTGLCNRRILMEEMVEACASADRYHHDLSVIMMDVDHFKRINDTYGHQAGDAVLRGLGELLCSELRTTDTAARYGGEEIILVCPHTAGAKAVEMAERIRERIMSTPIATGAGVVRVTVSMGVATYQGIGGADALLKAADDAMYAAKAAGRNRACLAESSSPRSGTGP